MKNRKLTKGRQVQILDHDARCIADVALAQVGAMSCGNEPTEPMVNETARSSRD